MFDILILIAVKNATEFTSKVKCGKICIGCHPYCQSDTIYGEIHNQIWYNTKSVVDLFLIIGNFFRYTKTHNYYFKIIPAGKLVPSLKMHYQIHLRIMDQYGISCHIFFYRDSSQKAMTFATST